MCADTALADVVLNILFFLITRTCTHTRIHKRTRTHTPLS